ncbi:MAG TPA: pilus assembly protein PilM, partial [Candidatus Paceibacterota bacterium]|nr:pilus assembly protein PilM [Candidatus Paceibacterota bacterium]
RKEHDLHFIRASVPETKSYIVKMELPRVADAEVRDAVEIHLEEYVPIPSRESVFDYKVLGFSGRDCSRMNLEVSVVHERTIQGYLEIFGGTGLTVASFENEAQAVARAVVSKNDPSTCMIVDFGAFRTGIYIVANGSIDFTTSIEMSGNMLSNMLRGKFLLSPEEIEEMKRTFDCNVFLLNEEQEAAGALMSFVSAFRDEISKHFVFWQTHRDEKNDVDKIQKIILTGSESILTGLAQYLSGSLDISVELANVWQNVFDFNEYIPEIGKRDSFQYSAAIGLALPSVSKDKEPR